MRRLQRHAAARGAGRARCGHGAGTVRAGCGGWRLIEGRLRATRGPRRRRATGGTGAGENRGTPDGSVPQRSAHPGGGAMRAALPARPAGGGDAGQGFCVFEDGTEWSYARTRAEAIETAIGLQSWASARATICSHGCRMAPTRSASSSAPTTWGPSTCRSTRPTRAGCWSMWWRARMPASSSPMRRSRPGSRRSRARAWKPWWPSAARRPPSRGSPPCPRRRFIPPAGVSAPWSARSRRGTPSRSSSPPAPPAPPRRCSAPTATPSRTSDPTPGSSSRRRTAT